MRVRKVTEFGDWTFGKGQNDYAYANAAVAQNVKTRLSCFLGDCFFDMGAGIDWFNQLGGFDQTALNLAIAATILNTTAVKKILSLNIVLDPRTRNLAVSYEVSTIYSRVVGDFSFAAFVGVRMDIGNQGFLLI